MFAFSILHLLLSAPEPDQIDTSFEEYWVEDPPITLLLSPALWSDLNPQPYPKALGFFQHSVQQAARAVVATCVRRQNNSEFKIKKDMILQILRHAALRSAETELDIGVRCLLRSPLVHFLQGELLCCYFQSWLTVLCGESVS